MHAPDDGIVFAGWLWRRSFVHLKLGDAAAALEDGRSSAAAEPTYEKAHLRVLAALEALGAPVAAQLQAVEQGMAATCGGGSGGGGGGGGVGSSMMLDSKAGRLRLLFAAEAKRASAAGPAGPAGAGGAGGERSGAAPAAGAGAGAGAEAGAGAAPPPSSVLAAALAAAADPSDPRHAMACGDVGAAYAVGGS